MEKDDKQYQQQMQDFGEAPKDIGTQILDPTLPSDLDFDKKEEQQSSKFDKNIQPQKNKILISDGQIQSYTVKGKSIFNMEPKYHPGSLIKHFDIQTLIVKSFDQQKGTGLKMLWQSIVGYVKRQIAFTQGFFYMMERKPEGLVVVHCWKLTQLFKVFIDQEEDKIRFVFVQGQKLLNKDVKVTDIRVVMQKLVQQLNKVGLRLQI